MAIMCMCRIEGDGELRVYLGAQQMLMAYMLLDRLLEGSTEQLRLVDAPGKRQLVITLDAVQNRVDAVHQTVSLTRETIAYIKQRIFQAACRHPHCAGMHCDVELHGPEGICDLMVAFVA